MDRDLVIADNKWKKYTDNQVINSKEEEEPELPAEQVQFYEQIQNKELDIDLNLDLDLDINLDEITEYKTPEQILNEEFIIKKTPLPANLKKDVIEKTTPKFLARAITPKQELFCRYYASSAHKGDGFFAYCRAYQFEPITKEDFTRAKSNTTKLLNNTHISKRITTLLKEEGLSRSDVDLELAFLIKQKVDLGAKNKAIDTYLKLTGAMKTQVEVSGTLSHKFLIPSNGRELQKTINPESEFVEGEVEESWDEIDDIEK